MSVAKGSVMNHVEAYLFGAVKYDTLSDAEKCAICAAMEGFFIKSSERSRSRTDFFAFGKGTGLFGCDWRDIEFSDLHYFRSGTAALRLVERFKIDLLHTVEFGLIAAIKGAKFQKGVTPSAAIVAAVVSLARNQWPYKESSHA